MDKFFINSGYIQSRNDNDIHFISENDIMELFQVSREDCVSSEKYRSIENDIEIILRPNHEYNLPKEIYHQIRTRIIPHHINKFYQRVESMNFIQRLKFLITSKVE